MRVLLDGSLTSPASTALLPFSPGSRKSLLWGLPARGNGRALRSWRGGLNQAGSMPPEASDSSLALISSSMLGQW